MAAVYFSAGSFGSINGDLVRSDQADAIWGELYKTELSQTGCRQ